MRRHAKAPSASSAVQAAATSTVAGRKARGLFGLACLCVLGLAAFLGSSAPSVGAAESLPGQGFLPNNRAWEMVSPQDKNGGDVAPMAERTRAASDGNAVAFVSLAGFADVVGFGVGTEYMSLRSTDPDPGDSGWATHAITPPQEPMGYAANVFAAEPRYSGDFSADLSVGVFRAWSPLTDVPNVADALNLYLRDDLRSPGVGNYQLLTDCPLCTAPLPPTAKALKTVHAGASADFSHVIFESISNLAPGAEGGKTKLYESVGGAVRLVGVLPNGMPSPSSGAGQLAAAGGGIAPKYTSEREISTDGSRIVFTDNVDNNGGGSLYIRINGRSTVQLNASELASPEAPALARYWDSSEDSSRVFFTSNETLTDTAPPNGIPKLYMWERQAGDEEQSVAIDATGGTFTLTFNEATTAPIPFNAGAGDVQSALEALDTVEPGNVSVGGGPGNAGATTPYKVTFTGDFAGANVAPLSADGSALSGGAGTAAVTTTDAVENLSLVNVDDEPADGTNEVLHVIGASADGQYVYFTGVSQLVAGGPDLSTGRGIFAWHDGTVSFVAIASAYGFDEPELSNNVNSSLVRKQARVTPDGRRLLFGLHSAVGPTGYNHGSCPVNGGICRELYLYSAFGSTPLNPDLVCVSCNPSGAPATAEASSNVAKRTGAIEPISRVPRSISDDGRYVFYTSAERLIPSDINGTDDAYLLDTVSDELHLISSGESSSPSYFLETSPDGSDAFFVTREQLSGWDVDQGYDLYDARIGGGFPEPPPPPPSCQGDACQPAPLDLNDPTPTSTGFRGPGNEVAGRAPKARCTKGRHRVKARGGKTRCVKKSRNANSNRRAGR